MEQSADHLILSPQVKKVVAAFLETRDASKPPLTKEEYRQQLLNRMRKKFVEMVNDFGGAKRINTDSLWAAVEKNLDLQLNTWPDTRLRNKNI
jgi:hypothetical protein